VVPATLPDKTIFDIGPEHIVWLDGVATAFGIGLTVTVAVIAEPGQPAPDVGVKVKVTVIGDVVVLVSEPLTFPLPLAAIPVTVPLLFLVHA
jgi:hypothetical protein